MDLNFIPHGNVDCSEKITTKLHFEKTHEFMNFSKDQIVKVSCKKRLDLKFSNLYLWPLSGSLSRPLSLFLVSNGSQKGVWHAMLQFFLPSKSHTHTHTEVQPHPKRLSFTTNFKSYSILTNFLKKKTSSGQS